MFWGGHLWSHVHNGVGNGGFSLPHKENMIWGAISNNSAFIFGRHYIKVIPKSSKSSQLNYLKASQHRRHTYLLAFQKFPWQNQVISIRESADFPTLSSTPLLSQESNSWLQLWSLCPLLCRFVHWAATVVFTPSCWITPYRVEGKGNDRDKQERSELVSADARCREWRACFMWKTKQN